jgi:hypothetical protein
MAATPYPAYMIPFSGVDHVNKIGGNHAGWRRCLIRPTGFVLLESQRTYGAKSDGHKKPGARHRVF